MNYDIDISARIHKILNIKSCRYLQLTHTAHIDDDDVIPGNADEMEISDIDCHSGEESDDSVLESRKALAQARKRNKNSNKPAKKVSFRGVRVQILSITLDRLVPVVVVVVVVVVAVVLLVVLVVVVVVVVLLLLLYD